MEILRDENHSPILGDAEKIYRGAQDDIKMLFPF